MLDNSCASDTLFILFPLFLKIILCALFFRKSIKISINILFIFMKKPTIPDAHIAMKIITSLYAQTVGIKSKFVILHVVNSTIPSVI